MGTGDIGVADSDEPGLVGQDESNLIELPLLGRLSAHPSPHSRQRPA